MESVQLQNNCPSLSEVCGDVLTVGMVVITMSCYHVHTFQNNRDYKILYCKVMATLKNKAILCNLFSSEYSHWFVHKYAIFKRTHQIVLVMHIEVKDNFRERDLGHHLQKKNCSLRNLAFLSMCSVLTMFPFSVIKVKTYGEQYWLRQCRRNVIWCLQKVQSMHNIRSSKEKRWANIHSEV